MPHGALAHVLSAGELCACASTLDELDEVLARRKFYRYQPVEIRNEFAGACAALVLLLPIAVVALAVRLTSKGPALYWSDRVGRNNNIFKMPKFRSMRVGTPGAATQAILTHLTV